MSGLISLKSPDKGFTSDYLGGKGFNLWRMAQAGINVPPAFIIPTEFCRDYMASPTKVREQVSEVLVPEIIKGLTAEFGYMPLVSVRSGAKFSMPGMMDTILNVGMTPESYPFWADKLSGACAADCAGRLNVMYANVVGGSTPHKVEDQLFGAIIAVFDSWRNERAVTYRNLNGIPHDLGTAVVVQAMVFGNLNEQSATGVLFSRDPSTGDNEIVGEYLVNAQGEDVVDGSHTPINLSKLIDWNHDVAMELIDTIGKLEVMNKDMQDVEFTVQDGTLYILQTRNAKRAAAAAVKVAVDMVEEGVITKDVALSRVKAEEVVKAARPVLNAQWAEKNPAHAVGLPASPGVVVGKAVFSAAAAVKANGPVILIAQETDPNDLAGMAASVGILTARGGMTSHAAVVARGMNKAAVVACEAIKFYSGGAYFEAADGTTKMIVEGTTVALDGSSGSVWVDTTPEMVGGATGSVKALLKLLSDTYGYYEVAVKADDIVNPARVVVPAYLMGVAEFEVEVAKMATMVEDLIVDLRDLATDPISDSLNALWGQPDSDMVHKAMSLASLKLKGVRVIPSRFKDDLLSSLDYTVIPVIKDWNGLSKASGLVVADHEALEASIKAKIPFIVKSKEDEGNPVRSLNCVGVIDKAAIERGVLFATTPLLAAQSLLG